MDKEKGWLDEVLKDVSEDAKSWPKWLKEESTENRNNKQSASERTTKNKSNTRNNFD